MCIYIYIYNVGLSENRVTLNPQVHHHFPQWPFGGLTLVSDRPIRYDIYIYIYIYVSHTICIYYERTYIHTSIHPYIHTSIHACIHTCVHAWIQAYIHTNKHTCKHTYILQGAERLSWRWFPTPAGAPLCGVRKAAGPWVTAWWMQLGLEMVEWVQRVGYRSAVPVKSGYVMTVKKGCIMLYPNSWGFRS